MLKWWEKLSFCPEKFLKNDEKKYVRTYQLRPLWKFSNFLWFVFLPYRYVCNWNRWTWCRFPKVSCLFLDVQKRVLRSFQTWNYFWWKNIGEFGCSEVSALILHHLKFLRNVDVKIQNDWKSKINRTLKLYKSENICAFFWCGLPQLLLYMRRSRTKTVLCSRLSRWRQNKDVSFLWSFYHVFISKRWISPWSWILLLERSR